MPLEIEVGDVEFNFGEGGSQSPVINPANIVEPYYKIVNKYERDLHRYMMGITSPNGFQDASVAFVQLASPTLLWVAEWVASSIGGKPSIPDMSVRNPDWVLLDEWQIPGMVDVMKNGQTIYYPHAGVYVYGHKNPSSVMINDINYACPPWIEPSAITRNVEQQQLNPNMIDNEQGNNAGNNVNLQQGFAHVQGGP